MWTRKSSSKDRRGLFPRLVVGSALGAWISAGIFPVSVLADEAERLLGPEQLSPAVRAIIDESAGDSAAQMKGVNVPGLEEFGGGSSSEGSEPRFILKYLSKDDRKKDDATAASLSEQLRRSGAENGTRSDIRTRVETNFRNLPSRDLGAKIQKNAESAVTNAIEAALTHKAAGPQGDANRIAPGVANADVDKKMIHHRQQVEQTLRKVGIDPKHPSIATHLDAFDPKIGEKIAQARKNGDGPPIKPGELDTGSFADQINGSANRKRGDQNTIVKPNIDTAGFQPPTPFASNAGQGGPSKKHSIADEIFNATAKAVADGRNIKIADVQPGSGDGVIGDDISINDSSIGDNIGDNTGDNTGDNIDGKGADATPSMSDITQDFAKADQDLSINDDPDQAKTDIDKDISKIDGPAGDQMKKQVGIVKPDTGTDQKQIDAGSRRTALPSVDKNDIEKTVNADVDKSVSDVTKRVNSKLTDVEKIIKEKTSGAFNQIKKQIGGQRDIAKANFDAQNGKVKNINVPPVKNNHVCVEHVWFICVKHADVPDAKSLSDHESAQARKDVAQGQANAAKDQYDAWSGAYNSVDGKKTDALNQISKAFSGARETVVSAAMSKEPGKSKDSLGDGTGTSSTQLASAKSAVLKEAGIEMSDDGHLSISGSVIDSVTADGAISAAVGDDSLVREYIGLIGRPGGGRESVSSVNAVVAAGSLIDAGIGYETQALADIGSIEASTTGKVTEVVTAIGGINASIGADSVSVLDVGTTKGSITGSEHLIVDATGIVNAAVGYQSSALAKVGTISSPTDGSSSHGITLNVNAPLTVNAAVGYASVSNLLLGNVDGQIHTPLNHRVNAAGAISASIGSNTESTVSIGNLSADVSGTYSNNISAAGVVAASIGANSSADVLVGNVGSKGELNGSGHVKIKSLGAIAAAIGGSSTSQVSIGNIRDTVMGSTKLDIDTGEVLAASLGGDTNAQVAIGDVNRKITGNLDSSITIGDTTVFALGGKADARAMVGVVDAPVTGNVNFDIVAGEVFVGALGYRNNAITQIGYVHGRDDGGHIGGNVDLTIHVGGVNNFSFGASVAGDGIHSRVSIGSILSNTTAASQKTISTGAVNAFSIGFEFPVPLLGTYFLGEEGCKDLGDVGSAHCPADANEITIHRE